MAGPDYQQVRPRLPAILLNFKVEFKDVQYSTEMLSLPPMKPDNRRFAKRPEFQCRDAEAQKRGEKLASCTLIFAIAIIGAGDGVPP